MVRNFNIERLMDLVKDIDMVRVEEIVSRIVSAMYKGAMEAELAKARFMLKITCARIAGRQQSEYFKKVMLELNPDKNTLKRIMKYMKFLRPGITEAEVTVIDVAYENYKTTFKRVKGERKEEQGYPYSSSYFFFDYSSMIRYVRPVSSVALILSILKDTLPRLSTGIRG